MSHARVIGLLLVVACGASGPAVQRVAFPNGNPHFEYELRDGTPDGVGKVWYESGALRSRGTYVNGVKHGQFQFYNEGGRFEYKALFWKDVEVWRSTDDLAEPPAELVHGLAAFSGTDVQRTPPEPEKPVRTFEISENPIPAPYFATLDRTTALNRAGFQFGFGHVNQLELFGNYTNGSYGGYARLSEALFDDSSVMGASGRQTAELGGSMLFQLGDIGTLAAHAGLLVPIGNDNESGYVASSAAARVHPSDAATSLTLSSALRTGASITRRSRLLVLQGDAGVDWIVGGQDTHADALVRANVGVGIGVRAFVLTLESTNTVRLASPGERLHALAAAGTFWVAGVWLTGAVAYGLVGESAVTILAGYEL